MFLCKLTVIKEKQKKKSCEILWHILFIPMNLDSLWSFFFASSLLQGLGMSWGQGSQWGALARTFPQSSWLVLQTRREMSLPPAPLLLSSQPNPKLSFITWRVK